MSSTPKRPGGAGQRGFVRGPQALLGGVALVALAGLALYLSRDLTQGTLRSIGSGMLPRWLAVAVGLCGIALTVAGLFKKGDRIEPSALRGPVFVMLAILAFAVTIRPFTIAGLSTPGLGMIAAGPLAIIIGGFATPEARLRDLIILALSLTPVCMVLFGDLLNLPIPIFPQAMAQLFPADWSQKAILRTSAAVLAVVAAAILVLTRGHRPAPVDVANHSGRI
jgi:hypothetical protein